MKISHINTFDVLGGAARAAYRLHSALVKSGHESMMAVKGKMSHDPSVVQVKTANPEELISEKFYILSNISKYYIDNNRTKLTDTAFSFPYPGYDLSEAGVIENSDVINLHWIGLEYQSPVTLSRLFLLGKPVVWTLHDQWAFSGGCHYSAGCDKYMSDCSDCPQLADDPINLPSAILKDKIELFEKANLTVVTPSRWLAESARKSTLFRNRRVEVVPNAVETDIFYPVPKEDAKREIGISPDSVTILFGADRGNAKRKGFIKLLHAIKSCSKKAEFKKLIKSGKVNILCFGKANDDLHKLNIPVVSLGYVNSDDKLRAAYSAADIFALPSIEDNLPNTMLESMSCATPVVAFDIGGMPDMIVEGRTGKLVPSGDVQKLGEAIYDLVFDSKKREEMGRNCREMIEKGFSQDIQARRYLELYQELIEKKRGPLVEVPPLPNKKYVPEKIEANIEISVGRNLEELYNSLFVKISKELPLLDLQLYRVLESNKTLRFIAARSFHLSAVIFKLALAINNKFNIYRRK